MPIAKQSRDRKFDRRLIGTWTSDRRRTFRHWKPRPGCRPAALRKLKSLFGKMIVCYTPRYFSYDFGDHSGRQRYEVLASDSNSVVIRTRDVVMDEQILQQIHFEENHYWIALGGGLCEFFKRID